MKKITLLLLAILFAQFAFAQSSFYYQTGNDRFSFKVQPFVANYVDRSSNIDNLNPATPTGMNFAIEFPSSQQRPWQQYLNNPTVGMGITTLDFGHDERMGHAYSVYPYILIPAIRQKSLELEVKIAAGLSMVSEHWYTQEDTDPDHYHDATTNTTFGSYLNAYLNAGLDLNIPLSRNLALNAEAGYIHMCNGRMAMPNVGANLLYGGVGILATINPTEKVEPLQFPDRPYGWCLNFTASAGTHAAAIADEHNFLISSLHAGAVYYLNNWYGVGAGFDVFYNGAVTNETDRSLYCKHHTYTTKDKIRGGIALNNEFKFGELTAIVDWGVYLFNPSRNLYLDRHYEYGCDYKNPLFFKTMGAGSEEAFHYWRMGVKYRVWDNLHLQVSAKLHLHICEFVEFGLNYQIPFLKKENRQNGAKIYHHHKNWWLAR